MLASKAVVLFVATILKFSSSSPKLEFKRFEVHVFPVAKFSDKILLVEIIIIICPSYNNSHPY